MLVTHIRETINHIVDFVLNTINKVVNDATSARWWGASIVTIDRTPGQQSARTSPTRYALRSRTRASAKQAHPDTRDVTAGAGAALGVVHIALKACAGERTTDLTWLTLEEFFFAWRLIIPLDG